MIYFPVLEFGWLPASRTIKNSERTSRKHSHWTQDPLNSAGSIIRLPRRSMNKLLIFHHYLNHSHPMSSRCFYKHTLLCVCARYFLYSSELTNLLRLNWTESLLQNWVVAAGRWACGWCVYRYLRMLIGFVDKSKWLKPAGTVGVICRFCCAESEFKCAQ